MKRCNFNRRIETEYKGYEANFSDNDILSVLIANAVRADLVVLLSNVDGLYDKIPEAN
jgi:glutamate 5-kinase